VRALLDAGATVRVVAVETEPTLQALAAAHPALTIDHARYDAAQLRDAQLVIAATNDSRVNEQVARDARGSRRLVNVVDAPEIGNCVTPAVHVAGDLVIAVSAGGVPGAARRIRDAIAQRFDERYARAIAELSGVRRALLRAGSRGRWREASDSLLGADFCERVEGGELADGVARWR
jgi:precorrin-2 dehydrogenase / sirohydrochlorin ferrochelatase